MRSLRVALDALIVAEQRGPLPHTERIRRRDLSLRVHALQLRLRELRAEFEAHRRPSTGGRAPAAGHPKRQSTWGREARGARAAGGPHPPAVVLAGRVDRPILTVAPRARPAAGIS